MREKGTFIKQRLETNDETEKNLRDDERRVDCQ